MEDLTLGYPAGENSPETLGMLNKNEPTTVAELAEAYDVHSSFTGRLPTVSFTVTSGPNKKGMETSTCQNQNLKLFIHSSADNAEYTPQGGFCISHMNGAFLSKKKAKEMVAAGDQNFIHTFVQYLSNTSTHGIRIGGSTHLSWLPMGRALGVAHGPLTPGRLNAWGMNVNGGLVSGVCLYDNSLKLEPRLTMVYFQLHYRNSHSIMATTHEQGSQVSTASQPQALEARISY
jgi:hypothetical protein